MLPRDLWLCLAYCNMDQDHTAKAKLLDEDVLHKLNALDCACMCLCVHTCLQLVAYRLHGPSVDAVEGAPACTDLQCPHQGLVRSYNLMIRNSLFQSKYSNILKIRSSGEGGSPA